MAGHILNNIIYKIKERFLKVNITPADKLKNILEFANGFIKQTDYTEFNHETLFLFIKMIADKINYEHSLSVIQNQFEHESDAGISGLFIDNDDEPILKYKLDKNSIKFDKPITIDLSTSPVIANTWNSDRIQNALDSIGTKDKPWKQDSNHSLQILLPFGVVCTSNGNHSIFSGTVRKTGKITIKPNSCHSIYDISHLYSKIYFDGTYYIDLQTKEIIGTAASFDFGCIFEIGRLMFENDISYPLTK